MRLPAITERSFWNKKRVRIALLTAMYLSVIVGSHEYNMKKHYFSTVQAVTWLFPGVIGQSVGMQFDAAVSKVGLESTLGYIKFERHFPWLFTAFARFVVAFVLSWTCDYLWRRTWRLGMAWLALSFVAICWSRPIPSLWL